MISQQIKETIRDVVDFPRPGVVFKDITPILKNPQLCIEITEALAQQLEGIYVDVVAGIESRGFLFGMGLAQRLGVPFVPIRKAGKLPYKTVQQHYDLEYGSATIEVHEDAFSAGQKVLIHDDLLATGGTVAATTALITKLNAEVAAYSFIINLDFLKGKELIQSKFERPIFSLVDY